LITTGPAAKVPSAKGFSAGGVDDTGAVKPQGPGWIGKDFRLDPTPRSPAASDPADTSSSASRRSPGHRGHWHTILHGEKRHNRRMHRRMQWSTRVSQTSAADKPLSL
jgi:hypothetical protein